jgi:ParB family chromosome partitioning protein
MNAARVDTHLATLDVLAEAERLQQEIIDGGWFELSPGMRETLQPFTTAMTAHLHGAAVDTSELGKRVASAREIYDTLVRDGYLKPPASCSRAPLAATAHSQGTERTPAIASASGDGHPLRTAGPERPREQLFPEGSPALPPEQNAVRSPGRTQMVPIASINVPMGCRLDETLVQGLVESIRTLGALLQPIIVTTTNELIAGAHRLEACRRLGWPEIPSNVMSLDSLRATLAQVDENLVRRTLTVLERAELIAERKRVYEALYPETRHGGAPGKQGGGKKAKETEAVSFAVDTARRMGRGATSVNEDARVGAMPPEVRDALRDTCVADSKSGLLELAKLAPALQLAAAKAIAEGHAKTVLTAIAAVNGAAPADVSAMASPTPGKVVAQLTGMVSKLRAFRRDVNTIPDASLAPEALEPVLSELKALVRALSAKTRTLDGSTRSPVTERREHPRGPGGPPAGERSAAPVESQVPPANSNATDPSVGPASAGPVFVSAPSSPSAEGMAAGASSNTAVIAVRAHEPRDGTNAPTRPDVAAACEALLIDAPELGQRVDEKLLKRTFRELAKAYHPDHLGGSEHQRELYESVVTAHRTLRTYNESLPPQRPLKPGGDEPRPGSSSQTSSPTLRKGGGDKCPVRREAAPHTPSRASSSSPLRPGVRS